MRHVTPADPPPVGDRWACLIQDRASRFVVAHTRGRRDEDLAERSPLRVRGARLTQTVTHHNPRGHLLSIKTRATIGSPMERPGMSHAEQLNGASHDRVHDLVRKTHAFAKDTHTWDASVSLALFKHNWLRPHPALRHVRPVGIRRYAQRTPAMALSRTDHPWSWVEFLTLHVSITI